MKGTTRLVDRTFAYKAGVSGTITIAGRVKSWAAFATGAGATVTIANPGLAAGDAIPIPTGGTVDGGPHDDALVNPTFVFTGTAGYFIEYIT